MVLLGSEPEPAAHGRAVAEIAVSIAAALGLPARRREMLRVAAGLHDLGNLSLAVETLNRPGPLRPAEWDRIRLHPIAGAQLLASAGLDEIAAWVRHHHERPDGLGYPDGLTGDAIPLESRIIAVGDGYDAMVSERPYSAALSDVDARQELLRGSGTQFDAQVVQTFLALHAAGRGRFRRTSALQPDAS